MYDGCEDRAMRRVTIILAVIAAALSSGTPAALGSRDATATERAALAQAFGVPRRCLTMRVATVRPGWASVAFKKVTGSCARYAADGVTVYRRIDDIWHQRFAGSSWSCPIRGVPEGVRKDLALGCPEGGG
jgi:hypothetical protein